MTQRVNVRSARSRSGNQRNRRRSKVQKVRPFCVGDVKNVHGLRGVI